MGSQWTWLTFSLLFSKARHWAKTLRPQNLWEFCMRGHGKHVSEVRAVSWCAGQGRSVPDALARRGPSNLMLSSLGLLQP